MKYQILIIMGNKCGLNIKRQCLFFVNLTSIKDKFILNDIKLNNMYYFNI